MRSRNALVLWWALGAAVSAQDGGLIVTGGYVGPTEAEAFKPGSDSTLPWTHADPEACRKLGKPVLLYIYDAALKEGFDPATRRAVRNYTARTFELNLFPLAKIKAALSGFTCVRVRDQDAGWPAELRERAKGGAACFLMTSNGGQVYGWWKGNLPSQEEFLGAAGQVAALNPRAQEQKAPPPGPQAVPHAAPVPGDAAQAKKEGQPPVKLGPIPGLEAEDEKERKKSTPRKSRDQEE